MILFFGILLTLLAYNLGLKSKKINALKKLPPIIFAGVLIILVLQVFNIDYDIYNQGAGFFTFLLGPATIALAFPLVKNIEVLTKHKRAVWAGLIVATFMAIMSTFVIGELLNVDFNVIMSMVPKSVTTPIAVEISKTLGGIPELTACVVILTGIVGGIAGHRVLGWFNIKNDIAIGLSIGATSHVIGTARCLEKNKDKQAAMSTLALIIVGVFTAVLAPFILHFVK
jgi:predicted murein hydrolase (TIGR00659 family)